MMHCAQRGCVVPEGTDATGLCPVCGNPLHIVYTEDPPPEPTEREQVAFALETLTTEVARLTALLQAMDEADPPPVLASSDPEGHQQERTDATAEVSHAQLAPIGTPEDMDRVAAEQDRAPGGIDLPAEDASPDNPPTDLGPDVVG
jgi:hypothetical protein